MSKLIFLGGAALLVAIAPAVAQHGKDMMQPSTRAEVAAKVKMHFAKMDSNSDGAVTLAETTAAREGMATEMRDKHFAEMDTNKDGSISRSEFDAQHQARKEKMGAMMHDGRGHEGMRGERRDGSKMLAHADSDKDGKVTLAEMTAGALAHFDQVDANKDGTITLEERKAMRDARHGEKHGDEQGEAHSEKHGDHL